MASSSDVDAATEALIAQLMAEDLGELYQRHSAPIGASYHDYEDPLSSYERQCLDAGEDPDEEGGEASGWGPKDPDEGRGAATADESLCSTMPASEGTWDSSFVDENGQVQKHTAPEQSPQAVEADDDNHSMISSCPKPENKELSSSPTRIVSLPAHNVATNPAGETRNISAPMTLPTQPNLNVWPGPNRVPDDHLHRFSHSKPSIPSNHLTPNERLSTSKGYEVEGQWDDGLDYSSYKGKGKAVRAYDEFKRGLRDGEKDRWDPNAADLEHEEEEDTDHDSEDEGEIRDEDLPFLRVPWPSIENDELLSRREDSEVVEIHVGDDETLESILRDISLRDERRRKGKSVQGSIEDHPSMRQKDVTAWW